MTGKFFAKLGLILHEVPFSANTLFRLLRETLNAGRVELFAEALGAVHARCISDRRLPQNDALGQHTAAGQKDGKSGLLNRDEGEQIQGADFRGDSHGYRLLGH